MCQGDFFHDVRAPAGGGGDGHVAVHDFGDGGGQVVLPRDVVYVYLHDADVRQRGAQAGAHEARQVAVVVVRRHVVLVHLRQVAHFLGLAKAVPRDVYHEHVRRVVLEVGDVVAHVKQVFARADARGGGVFYLAQALRLVHVDFEPQHVERLQGFGDSQRAFRLEVEVEV